MKLKTALMAVTITIAIAALFAFSFGGYQYESGVFPAGGVDGAVDAWRRNRITGRVCFFSASADAMANGKKNDRLVPLYEQSCWSREDQVRLFGAELKMTLDKIEEYGKTLQAAEARRRAGREEGPIAK